MNKKHANRLRNVVKSLRESKNPDQFTMECYFDYCGTPGCALGHYASRPDLQRLLQRVIITDDWSGSKSADLALRKAFTDSMGYEYAPDECVDFSSEPILQHFGIDPDEAVELFDVDGCGNAQTPNEAADYIEGFLARKGF